MREISPDNRSVTKRAIINGKEVSFDLQSDTRDAYLADTIFYIGKGKVCQIGDHRYTPKEMEEADEVYLFVRCVKTIRTLDVPVVAGEIAVREIKELPEYRSLEYPKGKRKQWRRS